MKLFGSPLSPFVRKARIVAAEKGIDYEYDPRPSPIKWSEGFEKINPLMRIPALLPDEKRPDFAINDSSAICAYFEKLNPTPALYPADSVAYGRALWIEEIADTNLASHIGLSIFRPVMFNVFAGKDPDYKEADSGFAKLEETLLPYLEAASDGEYFAGDDFSIADISVATQILNLRHVGYVVPAQKYPRFAARMEKALARSSFATFVDDDANFFEKQGINIPIRNA